MAILMEKCLAMLSDIQDFATLNSLGIIRRITKKFPEQMKMDWVKWSYQSFRKTGVQAKFPELVAFVRNASDEANSLYGKIFFESFKPSRPQFSAKRTTVLSTEVVSKSLAKGRKIACPFCKNSHQLLSCDRFRKAIRFKRVRFLARSRRCFRCLELGHIINECESQQGCVDNRHQTLLHKHDIDQTDSEKVVCAAMRQMDQKCVPRGLIL